MMLGLACSQSAEGRYGGSFPPVLASYSFRHLFILLFFSPSFSLSLLCFSLTSLFFLAWVDAFVFVDFVCLCVWYSLVHFIIYSYFPLFFLSFLFLYCVSLNLYRICDMWISYIDLFVGVCLLGNRLLPILLPIPNSSFLPFSSLSISLFLCLFVLAFICWSLHFINCTVYFFGFVSLCLLLCVGTFADVMGGCNYMDMCVWFIATRLLGISLINISLFFFLSLPPPLSFSLSLSFLFLLFVNYICI